MKVLHVIPSLDRTAGGPVFALEAMLKAQRSTGIDVNVVATANSTASAKVLVPDGMRPEAVRIVGPVYTPLKWSPRLAGAVKDAVDDADIVHCHGLWEQCQYEAAHAARSRRIPWMFTPHGMLSPWSLAQSSLRKRVYRAFRLNRMMHRCAGLHFTTSMELDSAEGIYPGVDRFVIPLNVDTPAVPPVRGQFRRLLNRPVGRGLVVFLGRVHPGKGLEYLVPAMAEPELAACELAVVGPESEGHGDVMRRLVRECGVADRVHFIGPVLGEAKWHALVDADVLALPSDHENFGMVVIEALAVGTPVVVSSSTGVASMISGSEAVRVAERASASVASAVTSFIGLDSVSRNAVSRQAIAVVEQAFSGSSVARQWQEAYERLIARAASDSAIA